MSCRIYNKELEIPKENDLVWKINRKKLSIMGKNLGNNYFREFISFLYFSVSQLITILIWTPLNSFKIIAT